MTLSRQEIFAQAAKRMRAEFEELSVVPHNGARGGEAEDVIRRFLDAHIPKRFAVTAGFIVDPHGTVSKQTDVIVYDAFNCPVYRASADAAIIPSSNVAVVVEVKSTLNKSEMLDAWTKIASIKSLAKHAGKPDGPFKAQTVGVLFAFTSAVSLSTALDHYHQLFREHGFGHHIDFVVILDVGMLSLATKMPNLDGWSLATLEGFPEKGAEGAHLAASAGKFDEFTLDAFMRVLIPQLIMFRPVVDHPGFAFSEMSQEGGQMISYLTSMTSEKDPVKKMEKLKAYAAEARAEMAKSPLPKDWGKK